AIGAFPPDSLRQWSETLGHPTFVGSSGRGFPRAFKASPLWRAWLRRPNAGGGQLRFRHHWTGGADQGRLTFSRPDRCSPLAPRATVLGLGGASWPRLGSDGGWVDVLAAKGVVVSPLRPANCGFVVGWSDLFRARFEGQPVKGIELTFDFSSVRGEVVITRSG